MRVVLPQPDAGFGIERNHMVVRGAQEQLVLDQNRRSFEGGFLNQVCLLFERSRAIRPRRFQLGNVGAIDLPRCRIAAAAWIIAIIRPSSI